MILTNIYCISLFWIIICTDFLVESPYLVLLLTRRVWSQTFCSKHPRFSVTYLVYLWNLSMLGPDCPLIQSKEKPKEKCCKFLSQWFNDSKISDLLVYRTNYQWTLIKLVLHIGLECLLSCFIAAKSHTQPLQKMRMNQGKENFLSFTVVITCKRNDWDVRLGTHCHSHSFNVLRWNLVKDDAGIWCIFSWNCHSSC